MKRRLTVSLVVITVATVAVVIMLNRPEPPFVTFGPHKTGVKFISFAQAQGKPLFDFTLPVIGRVAYPVRKPMDGIDPTDDPRFIAGYVVVESPQAAWENSNDAYWLIGRIGPGPAPKQTVLPVSFPRSESESTARIQIIDSSMSSAWSEPELVKVRCRFDPTKLPARYTEVVTNIGELKVHAKMTGVVRGNIATIDLKFSAPKAFGSVELSTSHAGGSSSSSATSSFPMDFDMEGIISKTGEVVATAKVRYSFGKKPLGKEQTRRIVFTPAAPGAIKRS